MKNNILVILKDNDKASYKNTTKGEFNKLLQRKFNSPEMPSFLMLNNKEEIIIPPKGYVTYDEFIATLRIAF
jgi:thioredoxin-related protein